MKGRLAKAGLEYLGMVDRAAPLVPPRLAAFANSTAAEGHEWAVSVENEAPDFGERLNHEWYMLCAQQGLFAVDDPQFLLAVAEGTEASGESWWARVRLRSEWDFGGAGAAAMVTGRGHGHPEFVMLSLDGTLVVRGSQGQEWTDIVCLENPHEVPAFRELGAQLTASGLTPARTRAALSRWLEVTRH
ncbi:hypothetical protein [Streptomyces sp. NPDC048224]|uniref:hypothetical protein n=1 Tax=unclassified Streptomyces TaxID=2593676 RepID=UPI0033DE7BBC